VTGVFDASAQDGIDELRCQIAELQAKVENLERDQKAARAWSGINDALRDKLEKTPILSFDSRGLRVSSPERTEVRRVTSGDGETSKQTVTLEEAGEYKFHLGTLLQPQGRFFVDTPYDNSTALFRRARLILDGTVYRNFDFLFQVDLLPSGLYVNNVPPTPGVTEVVTIFRFSGFFRNRNSPYYARGVWQSRPLPRATKAISRATRAIPRAAHATQVLPKQRPCGGAPLMGTSDKRFRRRFDGAFSGAPARN